MIIRKHLVPSLGHITIQKLTAAQVQALYAQKLKEGLPARSVVLIHAVLHRALDNAVRWGLVARNVTTLVTLPRPERYEAQTLTKEQAMKLLEAAKGSRLEALLLVALTTGMRRGELVALRWGDVDFEHGVLFVRRTLTRIIGHGYVETEPKTKTSRRKIVLPGVAVEALKMLRDRQDAERLKAGEKWHEQGIVFCNQSSGFYNPEKVDKHFQKLLKEAGLEYMRFHDLRHSAAAILLMAGVHPKVVQERMGHATIAMTMDIYSHVLPSMQQEAADKIDDMFRH